VNDIDSIKIIEEQIATQLNKEVSQLTEDDLTKTKELSLMGKYVSDITYVSKLVNLESLDISFTYVETVENLLNLKKLKKLNISSTHIKDIRPLKNLPKLDWLSMWNLWLGREQINEVKEKLPNLKIPDYQWDLYEKDSIGRIKPKLKVKLN
jgi:Leucine-rich repeat (LRR) protein